MSLEIYREHRKRSSRTGPLQYIMEDVLYRIPLAAGHPEPPLRVTYPIIHREKTIDGKTIDVIDPYCILIGETAYGKPFAYNPRLAVNPLILIVGTPGAGKSIPGGEKILVMRDGQVLELPIEEAKVGDKVLALNNKNEASFKTVISVQKFQHSGEILAIKLESGRTIRATPDHSFVVSRNGVLVSLPGSQLRVGDHVPVLTKKQLEIIHSSKLNEDDLFAVTYEKIVRIEKEEYEGAVYDLEVPCGDPVFSTFMLANGVFVHNSATVKTFIYYLLNNELFVHAGTRIPPVIVVDPEGEYGVLKHLIPNDKDVLHLKLGRGDYINIFDRPSKSISPISWYMRMLGVIQKFLAISPQQAVQAYRVLKLAIIKLMERHGFTNDPKTWFNEDITMKELYEYIEQEYIKKLEETTKKLRPTEKRLYSGANTLISRLDQWMYPPNDAFSKKSNVDLSKILSYKLIILDIRGLAKDLKDLFSYWITYWLYGLMLELGPLPRFGIRVVLILDEAWSLLRATKKGEENPLEALARRGRKYGILIVVATQTPEDVDKKMFSLFGTLVTGVIPSDSMVKTIVESRGMPKSFEAKIKTLEQGRLVWHINWRKRNFPFSSMPILVHTAYPVPELIHVEF